MVQVSPIADYVTTATWGTVLSMSWGTVASEQDEALVAAVQGVGNGIKIVML